MIEAEGGHDLMVQAVKLGIQSGAKTAHRYLEIGARVLDKADDTEGKHVHFMLITNVNFDKLLGAQQAPELPEAGRG